MKLLIPPPLIGLATGAGMWALAKAIPRFGFDAPALGIAALVIIGIGIAIEAISILSFLWARTTVTPLKPENASTLVVSGLYRISRNPMYLGLLILLTGWGLWLSNPVAFIPIPFFVAYMTAFQIKPEEDSLAAKFGDAYRDYRKRVRRWM